MSHLTLDLVQQVETMLDCEEWKENSHDSKYLNAA